MSAGTRRHQRQRSSVTIKKRISIGAFGSSANGEVENVPDNALSTAGSQENVLIANGSERDSEGLPTLKVQDSGTASFTDRHSRGPLFNPKHGQHISPVEGDEDGSDGQTSYDAQGDAQLQQLDYFSLGLSVEEGKRTGSSKNAINSSDKQGECISQHKRNLDFETANTDPLLSMQMGDTTTRSELDLFEDDDLLADGPARQTSPTTNASSLDEDSAVENSSSHPAPPLPPKDQDDRRSTSAVPASASSERSSAAKTPTMTDVESWSVKSTPTSAAKGPARRLSLLTGTSLLASPSSPSTSPNAMRSAALDSTTPASCTTPRGGRKAHRMSLGYFNTTSEVKSAIGSASSQPMTPPVSSHSTASVVRHASAVVSPRTSVSTAASLEDSVASTSLRSGGEGATMLTQHRGLLARIAERERAVLELREALAREEKELKALQKDWQTSASREMASKAQSGLDAMTGGVGMRSDETDGRPSSDSAGAADTFKGIKAKLQSGIGSQFNAFLDQLVSVPTTEEEKVWAAQQRATNPVATGLDALVEEEEVEDRDKARQRPSLPAKMPTAQRTTSSPASSVSDAKQEKRTSMFGVSFANFTKQMEQQFGASMSGGDEKQIGTSSTAAPASSSATTAKKSPAPASSEFGWGTLQKRLKEARENASGLLAIAEAKIGQAMTIDDIEVGAESGMTNAQQKRTRRPSPSAFAEENDREKAALAELSWLNSLAGVKTAGTVDRVVAVSESPVLDQTASRLSQQNLLHLDNGGTSDVARAASPASSSQSTTRPSPSLGAGAARIQSSAYESTKMFPSTSTSTARRGKRASLSSKNQNRTIGSGMFDVLSAVWASTDESPPPNQTSPAMSKDKRLSGGGQNRTRLAARAAVQQDDDRTSKAGASQASAKAPERTGNTWQWDDTNDEEGDGESGWLDGGMSVMKPSSSPKQSGSMAAPRQYVHPRYTSELGLDIIDLNDEPSQDSSVEGGQCSAGSVSKADMDRN